MAEFAFKGDRFHTVGELPAVGEPAPNFQLTRTDLAETALADLRGARSC
jgi:thiol peroxidase